MRASPAGDSRSADVFRFGVFELDARALELRRSGRRIALQQQPLQILAILVGRPAEVVTRDELRAALWRQDVYVDFDRGLNKAMAKLRTALDDSATSPRYIETLPRIGYRFIAPVETGTLATPPPPVEKPRRVSRLPLVAAVLVAIAIIAAFWWWRASTSVSDVHSLAVLPLDNLSGDRSQEYFADGMTDELITELAQIGTLRVISRTSVMRYKGTRRTVPEIARELGVDAIIEGSVARSGDRVRITAQLIDAKSDRHLWAKSYESDSKDVLEMQNAVARDIVDKTRLRLTPGEQVRLSRARPVNPAAHEAYLTGLYHWNKRDKASLTKAIGCFRQAIAIDPNYALPYAGIAQCYLPLTYFGEVRGADVRGPVMTALSKALQLDDSLAEAHAALGSALTFYDYDWTGAEREFRRAIELNPSYATAHAWYAQLLDSEGRTTEALEEGRRALKLDPLSLIVNAAWGHRLYRARRYDEGEAFMTRVALDLDPNFPPSHVTLGFIYAHKKMFPQAIAELEKAEAGFGDNALVLGQLGNAWALAGDRDHAESIVRRLEETAKVRYVDPYAFAMIYAGLGDRDRTFLYLQRASDDRDALVTFLDAEPMFDELRPDPRFTALLQHMRVPIVRQ